MSEAKIKVGDKIRIAKDCAACTSEKSGTILDVLEVYEDHFATNSSTHKTSTVWGFDYSHIHIREIELIEDLTIKEPSKPLGGIKYDDDKIDFSLMPIGPLTEVAKVWTFGKKKYNAWNWTKGFLWSRPYAAALRHIYLWASGEKIDPETGYSHLAHAICCLMMLIEFDSTETGSNDLYYNIKQENNNG